MSNEKKMIGEPSPQAIDHAKRLIALRWTTEKNIDTIAGTWQAGYVAAQLDYTVSLESKGMKWQKNMDVLLMSWLERLSVESGLGSFPSESKETPLYNSLYKFKEAIRNTFEEERSRWLDEAINSPKEDNERDAFVEKHLALIKSKMKDSFIHQHIEAMWGGLEMASVQHFTETGKVNGSFHKRIIALIDGVMKWQLNLAGASSLAKENDTAEIIVEKLGEYVNRLGRRDLGLPMMDEVAVGQMQYLVQQILDNPSQDVEIPEY
jgi:hypothetical protein